MSERPSGPCVHALWRVAYPRSPASMALVIREAQPAAGEDAQHFAERLLAKADRLVFAAMLGDLIETLIVEWLDEDENTLDAILRAAGSCNLCLPSSATFEPLLPKAIDVSSKLGGHCTYELPRDHGCPLYDSSGSGDDDLTDTIHCFALASDGTIPLNVRLCAAALEREEAARAIDDDSLPGAGVCQTNSGGFQSQGTLFDTHEDPCEHASLESFRELHARASAAMVEVLDGGAAVADADFWAPTGWKGEASTTADTATEELQPAYAWLNVNRATDMNCMHVHNQSRWSGVYFAHGGLWESAVHDREGTGSGAAAQERVQAGSHSAGEDSGAGDASKPARPSFSGHLVFRGGRQRGRDASHSYLAVPPVAGTLWLFPGRVPRAVLGHADADDPPRDERGRSDHSVAAKAAALTGRAPEAARISIAINFEAASADPLRHHHPAVHVPPTGERPAASPPELSEPVAVALPLRNGRTVSVRECRGSSWEGGSVWPTAPALVTLLNAAEHIPPEALEAASVLECGAGCGLIGLAAALLGARSVVLSDLAIGLPTLSANVAGNATSPEGGGSGLPVEVVELDWNAVATSNVFAGGRSFDIVFASECIYHDQMVVPLLRVLHQACAPDGSVFLAGIIGGLAMRTFQRHVTRFFADCEPIAATASADPPPVTRAIHRIRGPRPLVQIDKTVDLNHLLGGGGVWPAAFVLTDEILRPPLLEALRGAHILEVCPSRNRIAHESPSPTRPAVRSFPLPPLHTPPPPPPFLRTTASIHAASVRLARHAARLWRNRARWPGGGTDWAAGLRHTQ